MTEEDKSIYQLVATSYACTQVVIVSIGIRLSCCIEIGCCLFGSSLIFLGLETCSFLLLINTIIPCRVALEIFVAHVSTVQLSPVCVLNRSSRLFESITWQRWFEVSTWSHGRTLLSFLMKTDDTMKQIDRRSRWAVCSYCRVFHAINAFCQVDTRTFSKWKKRCKRHIQPKRNNRFFEIREQIEPKLDMVAED